MKWPTSVTLMRHALSAYNILKAQKAEDPLYQAFVAAYKQDYRSPEALDLAAQIKEKYSLGVSDFDTPITELGKERTRETGRHLLEHIELPDIILHSPYRRTCDTLEELCVGCPELRSVRAIEEDRIREQDHGLSVLYNDWRVFHCFHPEQKAYYYLLGPYWYQFPQGENIPNVRDRARSMTATIIREYQGQRVLMVTHHLTILSWRANFERLSDKQFVTLDKTEKPENCSLTQYVGNPNAGNNGKLELNFYNKILY
ncbi:MAG TPA: histidine phosphatase family protein [Candidatus Paceibacterota bacterium]|nr:histidine phosphatase family protein [Candidatus Paceibacterota bacterium]